MPTWSTTATIWGSITPLSGSELLRAMQLDSRVAYRVQCHYADASAVVPKDRFVTNSRTFAIHYKLVKNEVDRKIDFYCSEDVD